MDIVLHEIYTNIYVEDIFDESMNNKFSYIDIYKDLEKKKKILETEGIKIKLRIIIYMKIIYIIKFVIYFVFLF